MICKIAEPDEMPVDSAGNRADIVMDGNASVNRMNIGRLYELYTNAASRDVALKIRNEFGIKQKDHHAHHKVEVIYHERRDLFDRNYKYLMGYYSITSPKMYQWLAIEATEEQKIEHIATIIKKYIVLYLPPENEVEQVDVINQLELEYQPVHGPVTYRGDSGKVVHTKDKVRIGSMYIMLLEKTGDDWSGVSSAKIQHFGVPAQLTNSDKYSQPTRNQPVKGIGESEARIFTSYAGVRAMAELMDRNNTPSTHREMVWNILDAENPTNIDNIVDRKKKPYGGAKPVGNVNHAFLCAGIKLVYHEDV